MNRKVDMLRWLFKSYYECKINFVTDVAYILALRVPRRYIGKVQRKKCKRASGKKTAGLNTPVTGWFRKRVFPIGQLHKNWQWNAPQPKAKIKTAQNTHRIQVVQTGISSPVCSNPQHNNVKCNTDKSTIETVKAYRLTENILLMVSYGILEFNVPLDTV